MEEDWLTRTCNLFEEFETPKRFNYWSLLTAVSAIVKDRVYWDKYRYKLYPNIYVLLFGPSGIRKGPPIAFAKDIVARVGNTRIINGRATVEAIIKELGTVKKASNGTTINDSAGFINSSEMSSAIIGNTNSLDILTDLFDRIYNEGEWIYRIKNGDPIKLKNPTVTWLAGSNEALFREFVPEKNLRGGLIGRTFIISEHKINKLNSLMFPPIITIDKDKVAQEIKHIANLEGPFEVSLEVRQGFDEWYHNFKSKTAPKLEDDTGTLERADDNILRIAMLISLARRGDMIVTEDDIIEATEQVIPLIAPAKKISNTVKTNEMNLGQKRILVLEYLAMHPENKETRVNLLRKFALKMDNEDLDRIVAFLASANVIKQSSAGGVIVYALDMTNEKVKDFVEGFRK